jgi:hypothetical protein
LKNTKEWHDGFALYGPAKQFKEWSAEQLLATGIGDAKRLEQLQKTKSKDKSAVASNQNSNLSSNLD